MRIAGYTHDSIVDGHGLRFTLFAQGCPHRCEGCHNPDTHDIAGGYELSNADIIKAILSNPLLDGITFSGGEPFAQPEDCIEIAIAAKAHGLSVWAYTGWLFEELIASSYIQQSELLRLCDVLVDGRFDISQRSLSLKWRGSANQRIIDVRKSFASDKIILYAD